MNFDSSAAIDPATGRGTTVTLSDGGYTATLVTMTEAGTRTVTLTREPAAGPFTDEGLDRLVEISSRLPSLADGERRRVHRTPPIAGHRLYVHINTGPPTWWVPRVQVKERSVMVGWLRGLVAVKVAPER